MRYYPKGTDVIANCGTRKVPEWIEGKVVEYEFIPHMGERHRVKLIRPDKDGKDIYWFSVGYLIENNARNRKRLDSLK